MGVSIIHTANVDDEYMNVLTPAGGKGHYQASWVETHRQECHHGLVSRVPGPYVITHPVYPIYIFKLNFSSSTWRGGLLVMLLHWDVVRMTSG